MFLLSSLLHSASIQTNSKLRVDSSNRLRLAVVCLCLCYISIYSSWNLSGNSFAFLIRTNNILYICKYVCVSIILGIKERGAKERIIKVKAKLNTGCFKHHQDPRPGSTWLFANILYTILEFYSDFRLVLSASTNKKLRKTLKLSCRVKCFNFFDAGSWYWCKAVAIFDKRITTLLVLKLNNQIQPRTADPNLLYPLSCTLILYFILLLLLFIKISI